MIGPHSTINNERIIRAMKTHSTQFYDLRFGILIAIIISILLFKFITGQTVRSATERPSTQDSRLGSDTVQQSSLPVKTATAH